MENGSLFIATPFRDKHREVTNSFLNEHQLEKALGCVENDPDKFRKLWQKAKNLREHKIPGTCGGSGANVMLPFAKLGHPCSILGRIGDDKRGEKIEKHFSEINIHSLLVKSTNKQTGTALCFTTPDRERTMVAHLGAVNDFTHDDIDEEKLKKHRHWHIEGYTFYNQKLASKCFQIASKHEALISLNLPTKNVVQMFRGDFQKAAAQLHYLFGNVEEILTLAGVNDDQKVTEELIQKAFAFFPLGQTVAATDGANGCWVKVSGEQQAKHYPTPRIDPSKIKNKTGAGDIWAGIFLALAMKGMRVEECVRMANEGAAEWIQKEPGTSIPEKTWEVFRKQIEKN